MPERHRRPNLFSGQNFQAGICHQRIRKSAKVPRCLFRTRQAHTGQFFRFRTRFDLRSISANLQRRNPDSTQDVGWRLLWKMQLDIANPRDVDVTCRQAAGALRTIAHEPASGQVDAPALVHRLSAYRLSKASRTTPRRPRCPPGKLRTFSLPLLGVPITTPPGASTSWGLRGSSSAFSFASIPRTPRVTAFDSVRAASSIEPSGASPGTGGGAGSGSGRTCASRRSPSGPSDAGVGGARGASRLRVTTLARSSATGSSSILQEVRKALTAPHQSVPSLAPDGGRTEGRSRDGRCGCSEHRTGAECPGSSAANVSGGGGVGSDDWGGELGTKVAGILIQPGWRALKTATSGPSASPCGTKMKGSTRSSKPRCRWITSPVLAQISN